MPANMPIWPLLKLESCTVFTNVPLIYSEMLVPRASAANTLRALPCRMAVDGVGGTRGGSTHRPALRFYRAGKYPKWSR